MKKTACRALSPFPVGISPLFQKILRSPVKDVLFPFARNKCVPSCGRPTKSVPELLVDNTKISCYPAAFNSSLTAALLN